MPISEVKNRIRGLTSDYIFNNLTTKSPGGDWTKQELDFVNKISKRVWKKFYTYLTGLGEK